MAKTVTRSLRIDEELKDSLDSLPEGTVNTLVNELLTLFFENDDVQKMVILRDDRFKPENWDKAVGDTMTADESANTKMDAVREPDGQPADNLVEPIISAAPDEKAPDTAVPVAAATAEEVKSVEEFFAPAPAPVQKPVESVEKSPLDEMFG